MPIIIRSGQRSSSNDLIRKFKKAVFASNIVQIVRDRHYFVKPARMRALKKIEFNRLRKRLHSIKRAKNTSASSVAHLVKRLGTRT